MIDVGRSTLIGEKGVLIGFGFADHPIVSGYFMGVVFYKTPKVYVVCVSEGPHDLMPMFKRADLMRPDLGQEVAGEAFAPYAQRAIDVKIPYEEFKKTMVKGLAASIPNINFEWWK